MSCKSNQEMSIYVSETMCNSLCRKYVSDWEEMMPMANRINITPDKGQKWSSQLKPIHRSEQFYLKLTGTSSALWYRDGSSFAKAIEYIVVYFIIFCHKYTNTLHE